MWVPKVVSLTMVLLVFAYNKTLTQGHLPVKEKLSSVDFVWFWKHNVINIVRSQVGHLNQINLHDQRMKGYVSKETVVLRRRESIIR